MGQTRRAWGPPTASARRGRGDTRPGAGTAGHGLGTALGSAPEFICLSEMLAYTSDCFRQDPRALPPARTTSEAP
jgi:hypothetical protein